MVATPRAARRDARPISVRCWLAIALLSLCGPGSDPGLAQSPAPPPTQSQRAARRFPQPVRVGDLIDRQVLRPVEQQQVLGRVAAVVRHGDGAVFVVVRIGGVLGLGARPVAVPVEAMTLLGEYMEIVDLSPEQLQALPTSEDSGATTLAPDAIIRVGLARPSH